VSRPSETLRALDAAATPGPWLQSRRTDQVYAGHNGGTVNVLRTWSYGGGKALANRRLILAQRNLLPQLLDLWEAVQQDQAIGTGTLRALITLNTAAAREGL